MSSLRGRQLERLHPFVPMLHAKEKCCINKSRDDFRIIGKEKDRYLVRLKKSIFINYFSLSLNTKEGKAELLLFSFLVSFLRSDIKENCANKFNIPVFVLCVK